MAAVKRVFSLSGSRDRQAKPAVPLEIYASLVDAVYELSGPFFIGSIAAFLGAAITAFLAQSLTLAICAGALAVVAFARAIDMRAYHRHRPTLRTEPALRRWEVRYVFGAAIYVSILGIWCLCCYLVSDDLFIRLMSFCLVLAYMVGTSGRNFASRPLVLAQIVGAGVPLSIAVLSLGGWYYALFAIVVVPFLASLKMISDRLRGTLLDAVITARDITQLAARFTTALNNMPHGLVMFDAERRLLVANARFTELLHLRHDDALVGGLSSEILGASDVLSGTADFTGFLRDFDRSLSGPAGELDAETTDGRWLAFTARPMDNGGSVVIVEDVTERRTTEQRIHRLARYDSLTGLPNRNHLHDTLTEALLGVTDERPLGVLFVDLDDFKQVNDTLGHPRGDLLLCAVADRLRTIIAAPDTIARFGGDEFVVLHRLTTDGPDELDGLAQRILELVSRTYNVDGHHVVIGASIGVALAPKDGTDPDLLLKNADMALYHAKSLGKGSWRYYDLGMDEDAKARMALEQDLRQAVADESFELYYQPLINLRSMQIATCEALLRWNHPTRGRVSPADFIPMAEDIGVIMDIGDWVIRQAVRECARWPSDVCVAVNLSSVQFRRDKLISVIADALRDSGLPANRLEIEITESVLLQDTPTVRAMLQQLVDLGIRISLDDFGTGYSSLSYLHTFPLSKVKIDRSFVSQLTSGDRSLTLLKGVARLSAALGLSVTVEGIETPEQLDIIAAVDAVDEAQGFVFSMPLPAAQIRDLIAAQSRPASRPARPGSPKKQHTEAA